ENGSTEYDKAIRFLDIDYNCGCSKMIPRGKFAELRKAFQALERDIFLMAQLKAMNGGEITASRRLKRKRVLIRGLFIIEIAIRLFVNMLGIGRTHFENVRNHLVTNGIIPRVYYIKRVPQWRTKI